MQTFNLWDKTPGLCEENPTITYYKPENQKSDAAIVILPGGGYSHKAPHEGEGYAKFLAKNGIPSFVVMYRTAPHSFPLPLLDSRRALRYVRYYAEKFGINKNKVAIMGSSAGGHLAALTSTYFEPIEFEGLDDIDKENFIPDRQILCYPVINIYNRDIAHIGSGNNLLGEIYDETQNRTARLKLSPNLLVSEKTPEAFIWHTFEDGSVNVKNSLEYIWALKDFGIATEFHMFPHGHHGLGLANEEPRIFPHVAQWANLLINWLEYTF